MKVCGKHHLHLISDEIYGLSTWDNAQMKDGVGFTSVLSLEAGSMMDARMVHVVWGLSKVRNEPPVFGLIQQLPKRICLLTLDSHRTLAPQACESAVSSASSIPHF